MVGITLPLEITVKNNKAPTNGLVDHPERYVNRNSGAGIILQLGEQGYRTPNCPQDETKSHA